MNNIKVVFMGTPEFALPTLKLLIKKTNVVLVVSKKDAYVGRKKILTPSVVKKLALEHNISVFTPDNIKKDYKKIIECKPDLIITCAYGKIIPKPLLDYPKYGCINIHASLLPKYRGCDPIRWVLINGEEYTGITLMYMNEFMDKGDIISFKKYLIKEEDDIYSLTKKLSEMGAVLLEENLENIITNNCQRIKQNNNLATYAPMINREMEELDFNNRGKDIINKIRAFSPNPLTKTTIFKEEVKIVKAHFNKGQSQVNKIYLDKKNLGIGAKDGIIYLDIIKPIGKKIMLIQSYLNGRKDFINEKR